MADTSISISASFPGEQLLIALINLFVELIKGASPEQRVIMWDNWIRLTQPVVDALISKQLPAPAKQLEAPK